MAPCRCRMWRAVLSLLLVCGSVAGLPQLPPPDLPPAPKVLVEQAVGGNRVLLNQTAVLNVSLADNTWVTSLELLAVNSGGQLSKLTASLVLSVVDGFMQKNFSVRFSVPPGSQPSWITIPVSPPQLATAGNISMRLSLSRGTLALDGSRDPAHLSVSSLSGVNPAFAPAVRINGSSGPVISPWNVAHYTISSMTLPTAAGLAKELVTMGNGSEFVVYPRYTGTLVRLFVLAFDVRPSINMWLMIHDDDGVLVTRCNVLQPNSTGWLEFVVVTEPGTSPRTVRAWAPLRVTIRATTGSSIVVPVIQSPDGEQPSHVLFSDVFTYKNSFASEVESLDADVSRPAPKPGAQCFQAAKNNTMLTQAHLYLPPYSNSSINAVVFNNGTSASRAYWFDYFNLPLLNISSWVVLDLSPPWLLRTDLPTCISVSGAEILLAGNGIVPGAWLPLADSADEVWVSAPKGPFL